MNIQKVTVRYIYEGKSFDSENGQGVLISENRVFVSDKEGVGIYAIQQTDDPTTVTVNLDVDDTDYLVDNGSLLLDLVAV